MLWCWWRNPRLSLTGSERAGEETRTPGTHHERAEPEGWSVHHFEFVSIDAAVTSVCKNRLKPNYLFPLRLLVTFSTPSTTRYVASGIDPIPPQRGHGPARLRSKLKRESRAEDE